MATVKEWTDEIIFSLDGSIDEWCEHVPDDSEAYLLVFESDYILAAVDRGDIEPIREFVRPFRELDVYERPDSLSPDPDLDVPILCRKCALEYVARLVRDDLYERSIPNEEEAAISLFITNPMKSEDCVMYWNGSRWERVSLFDVDFVHDIVKDIKTVRIPLPLGETSFVFPHEDFAEILYDVLCDLEYKVYTLPYPQDNWTWCVIREDAYGNPQVIRVDLARSAYLCFGRYCNHPLNEAIKHVFGR